MSSWPEKRSETEADDGNVRIGPQTRASLPQTYIHRCFLHFCSFSPCSFFSCATVSIRWPIACRHCLSAVSFCSLSSSSVPLFILRYKGVNHLFRARSALQSRRAAYQLRFYRSPPYTAFHPSSHCRLASAISLGSCAKLFRRKPLTVHHPHSRSR